MSTWKPVVAVLGDDQRRLLWARIVTAAADGQPLDVGALTAAERRRLDALAGAGLVEVVDGAAHPLDAFSPLLTKIEQVSGVERFLVHGRIVTWPRRAADREALLDWAADRAVVADEQVTERAITERLAHVSDDPASLRRHLYDAGRIDRFPDGATYWRVVAGKAAQAGQ